MKISSPMTLIGMPYKLGGNGEDGSIDCIHLAYAILEWLEVPLPAFQNEWYTASLFSIAKSLLRWGARIHSPHEDGDVLLLPNEDHAFAVVWQSGIFYINRDLGAVAWCPINLVPHCPAFRCRSFLTKSI